MSASHPTETAVRAIVAPYEQRIAGCLERGVAMWQSIMSTLGLPVSNRTRANLIYDYISNEAEREFISDAGVRVKTVRGLPYLLIDGKVAVRFKKFRNSSLAVATGRTRQQEQIGSHQLLLSGCDLAPVWLTAGYLLDDTGLDAQYAMTFAVDGAVQYVLDLSQPTVLSAPVVPIVETDDEDEDGLVIRSARQSHTAASGHSS